MPRIQQRLQLTDAECTLIVALWVSSVLTQPYTQPVFDCFCFCMQVVWIVLLVIVSQISARTTDIIFSARVKTKVGDSENHEFLIVKTKKIWPGQHTIWGLVVCRFHKWEACLWLFCLLAILGSAFPSFQAGVSLRDDRIGLGTFPTPLFAWALSAGILAVLSPLLDQSKTCPVPVCIPLCLSQFHGVGCGDFEAVFSHVDFQAVFSHVDFQAVFSHVDFPGLNPPDLPPIFRCVSLSSRSLNAFHKLPNSVLYWGCGIQSACGGLSLVWDVVSNQLVLSPCPWGLSMHSISFPSVFYIEDVVSSQLVVVFPWFGNMSQEAVCPVLRYNSLCWRFLGR